MKFKVQARRVMSRVATDQPVRVTLRIRSLCVQSAKPFSRRLFTAGILEGVAHQVSRHVDRIARASRELPEYVAVSVPPVSMRMPAGLGFGAGRTIGDSCAEAVSTGLEKHRAP